MNGFDVKLPLQWFEWEPLDGPVDTHAVCSWGQQRVDMFARRIDWSVLHRYSPAYGKWTAWEKTGKAPPPPRPRSVAAIAAASWGFNRADWFVLAEPQLARPSEPAF